MVYWGLGNNFTSWVNSKVSSVVSSVTGFFTGGKKAKGSYASGLDYVPQDGVYKLHEGEAILTKEQNRNRNFGNGGGDTFNFYSPKALDEVSAAREMRRAKQRLRP